MAVEAVEIKGEMLLLNVLHLHSPDTVKIKQGLQSKRDSLPQLFANSPLVLTVRHWETPVVTWICKRYVRWFSTLGLSLLECGISRWVPAIRYASGLGGVTLAACCATSC